jgi:hypothetical protein
LCCAGDEFMDGFASYAPTASRAQARRRRQDAAHNLPP